MFERFMACSAQLVPLSKEIMDKNWLYSLAIGCTLPARGIASLNDILFIFVVVMSD